MPVAAREQATCSCKYIYSIVVISIWKGPEPNWATPKGELEFGITDMPLLETVNVIFNAVVEGVIV